jgi:hypothetical protein
MVSGRPILIHAPPYCFLSRFARREQFALVVDENDPLLLREGVERLLKDADLCAHLVSNARRVAQRFRGEESAGKLKRELFGRGDFP